jgi:hypothetical protein
MAFFKSKPTPPAPSGRVSFDQFQQDFQQEQEAIAACTTLLADVNNTKAGLDAAQKAVTDDLTELSGVQLPETVKAVQQLTTDIYGNATPNVILQDWRAVVLQMNTVTGQALQALADMQDLDSVREDYALSCDILTQAIQDLNATSNIVNADLRMLNLTPLSP